MHPRIRTAKATGNWRVALEFSDGSRRIADLEALLAGEGGVFAPLQDPAYFAKVSVDTEAGTVVWPNGVDLDPDVLFELARPADQP